MATASTTPERRATGDTLILPFTVGMLIGGIATGILGIAVGQGKALLGLGELVGGFVNLSQEWLYLLAFSVLFGSLLELGILKVISLAVRLPLALRVSSATLVVLGIVAASASTIASCLTIDLGPHPEIPFYKGPDPPFARFVLVICALAPLLLVKRAPSSSADSDSTIVDHSKEATEGAQKLTTNNEATDKDSSNV